MKRALLVLAGGLLILWPRAGPAAQDVKPGQSCADCHGDVVAKAAGQTHMRIQPFEVHGRGVGCEGCHGDGAKHMESGDPADISRFDKEGSGDSACLECHKTRGLSDWHASTHEANDVSCTACHTVHTPTRPQDACRSCHADVVSQFQLPSHHPVREGRMACTSCHDAHSANEAQLKTGQRVNELCYGCHQEKEGPFIFEHDPVQEDCRSCHNPHGTVARRLLTVNEPMLCLQCHEMHFHAGYQAEAASEVEIGRIPRENPFGAVGFNKAFTTRCSQCHSRIHGSDLPVQGITSGGGLTR